jgi:NAD(P)-dependent dehydrogenase (short-subunit alcohol dehydrogenase family)
MSARRRAIVTGSDSGIGRATAVVLAEAGWDVGLTRHTDDEGVREAAEECRAAGASVVVASLEQGDARVAAGVVDQLVDGLGGLDALVNVAGTGSDTPFLEQDLDDWEHVLAVDLTGPFALGQAAARRMVDAGTQGRIVNVTSVHEHVPLEGASAYCAAKGGLGLLTKVMALELGAHGITVNAVAPGEISTPMTGQDDVDPHTVDRPGLPLGRPGHAREVAALIAHLVGAEASYTTGASFVVDGGLLLMAGEANRRLQ